MNGKFVLRTGKFAGKTVDWLRDNNPMYLLWVEENQPNMLKEKTSKIVQSKPVDKKKVLPDYVESAMKPNTNFYNEPPDKHSLDYINKNKGIPVGTVMALSGKSDVKQTKKEDDEWNF